MVLSTALKPAEIVQAIVHCRFLGADAALAVTDQRLVIANAREWDPDVVLVDLEPGLVIQGWQSERSAALVFSRDGHELVVDRIADRDGAQQIAAEVRRRVGG